jgi:uncharacterized protein YbjQ (UPF0145 family)
MLVTGFSGNELYCLAEKGWGPGGIVVGNSVQSLGFAGGISSSLRTIAGGEIENLTSLISEGRHAAIKRLEQEAQDHGAHGVTGVYSGLKQLSGLKEFIAIGSSVKGANYHGPFFTTACTGQDFYCQLDAGYEPRHFVIGNVAYALGMGKGFSGMMRGLAGGEVKEFSDMFNRTRHMALTRLEAEALLRKANAVVDIQTHIIPVGAGASEMLMVGTACHHPAFASLKDPVTSELTGEELWNLAKLGYAPLRLLLGTSVYSLGVARGIGAFFKGMSRGEVDSVTQLIYEARTNCLAHIHREAKAIGADGVIGVKIHIYEIGNNYIEVIAIGTAIKKMSGIETKSEALIPQAIIRDRETFFDYSHLFAEQSLARP